MNQLFIIGAQRSGSTYLYQILDEHPEVVMARPVRPEPKFFLNDEMFDRGRSFYEANYFTGRSANTKYIGEKSTSYIESQLVAARIHQFYPNTKILIILRDPVIRAYSNYRFSLANQLEDLSFNDALAAEKSRSRSKSFVTSVNPYAYCERGQYINYIEDWFRVFDRDQIEILIFEEFICNLEKVQQLYRSLGVSDNFEPPSLQKVVNPTEKPEQDYSENFRSLAQGYGASLGRLENFLGRKIDVWHQHWSNL